MPCRIVTKYGSVSDASFKLASRYVRVGTESRCELVVLERGLPSTIFVLEATPDRNVWRLHSSCSNLVVYNGTLLTENQVVDWRVGESVNVGGLVEFELVYESSRRVDVDSNEQTPQTSRAKQTFGFEETSSTNVKDSKSKESSSSKESTSDSKSNSSSKTIVQWILALGCVFLLVVMLRSPSTSSDSSQNESRISDDQALVFCDAFNDQTIKTLCVNGIINQRRDQDAARRDFRKLESYVRKEYEIRCIQAQNAKQLDAAPSSTAPTYREFFKYLNSKLANN